MAQTFAFSKSVSRNAAKELRDNQEIYTFICKGINRSMQTYANVSEMELCARIKAGDKEAASILAQKNTALLNTIALRMMRSPEDHADCFQNGYIALYEAALKYDAEKGAFSSYSSKAIGNAIADAQCADNVFGKSTDTLRAQAKIIRKAISEWQVEYETLILPSIMEIADRTGLSEERVEEVLRTFSKVVSTDAPISGIDDEDEGSFCLGDMLQSSDHACAEYEAHEYVESARKQLLGHFSPKQVDIFSHLAGWEGDPDGESVAHVADLFGCTEQYVNKLRRDMGAFLFPSYSRAA